MHKVVKQNINHFANYASVISHIHIIYKSAIAFIKMDDSCYIRRKTTKMHSVNPFVPNTP